MMYSILLLAVLRVAIFSQKIVQKNLNYEVKVAFQFSDEKTAPFFPFRVTEKDV